MKIRRETKIGLLAAAALFLAIWGFQYLKGVNMLNAATVLYADYDNVMAIRESTPIYINGLQVGLVVDLYPSTTVPDKITVEMSIDTERKIPKDAVAAITVLTLMGDKSIEILFDKPCSGDDCAETGDYLTGETRGTLASMASLDDVKSYMDLLSENMEGIFAELKAQVSKDEKIGETLNDLSATVANLKSATGKLDHLLGSSSGSIKNSLANLETITDTLEASSSSIKSLIENADKFSKNLNELELAKTMDEATLTFQKLQTTLGSADKAIEELKGIMGKLNSGDGAIAMLLNDKKFADQLKLTASDVQLLLQDIRLHPERYRRILSKKKMEYEAPEKDPGH